jgi:hypothetical protein
VLRVILLSTLVLCGAACTTRISAEATPPATYDAAVQCVATDPGWRAISVHRALHCPAGTEVVVQGIVVSGDGGTMLCDSQTIDENCLDIVDASPVPFPTAVSGKAVFSGVVSGHRLVLLRT